MRQTFLEHDYKQSLQQGKQKTIALTDEANSIINQVRGIVSLLEIDDSKVLSEFDNAEKQLDDAVTQLEEFDTTRSSALVEVYEHVKTMRAHIEFVQGMISNGAKTLHVYPTGVVKQSAAWQNMNKQTVQHAYFSSQYPAHFANMTVPSQYASMYDLYYGSQYTVEKKRLQKRKPKTKRLRKS
nr:T7SS effector LXG polymorphic toxin [Bacillus sp. CGMCC 1.16541]